MNIYEAETPHERRDAAIELCVAAILRVTDSTASSVTHIANYVVPPLPTQYNRVRVKDCVVEYHGGDTPWAVFYDNTESHFGTLAGAIDSHISPTDDELPLLLDLKANPVKVASVSDAPDKDCVTLPDGSCVSTKHCMHGPPVAPEYNDHKGVTYVDGKWWRDDFYYPSAASCVVNNSDMSDDDHAALMELKANPVKVATPEKWTGGTVTVTAQQMADDLASGRATYTTPATVAGEPVAWANLFRDGSGDVHPTLQRAEAVANADSFTETAVPLYRHAMTSAEAIALLVREGAKQEVMNLDTMDRCPILRNVLILPTPERAS